MYEKINLGIYIFENNILNIIHCKENSLRLIALYLKFKINLRIMDSGSQVSLFIFINIKFSYYQQNP